MMIEEIMQFNVMANDLLKRLYSIKYILHIRTHETVEWLDDRARLNAFFYNSQYSDFELFIKEKNRFDAAAKKMIG